jgi:hypothetical protein
VVVAHPPNGRVGKQLKPVGAPGSSLLHHDPLLGVDAPVPARGRRIGTILLNLEALDLTGFVHFWGDDRRLPVDGAQGAGAGAPSLRLDIRVGPSTQYAQPRALATCFIVPSYEILSLSVDII